MTDTTPNPLSFTTNGGPAFPLVFDCGDGTREIYSGMSLRDWFAGMAMQSVISTWPHVQNSGIQSESELLRITAEAAYRFADAMLKERKHD